MNILFQKPMPSIDVDLSQVKVSSRFVQSIVKGFPVFIADIAETLLYVKGITDLNDERSHALVAVIEILEDIQSKFGSDTVYEIGKEAQRCCNIEYSNFEQALNGMASSFNLNHGNKQICAVKILKYSLSGKLVQVQVNNPYPVQFNRGFVTALAREFNPIDHKVPTVVINHQVSHTEGVLFDISW